NPAAELGAGEADDVADHPKQRGIVLGVDHHRAVIDLKRGHVRSPTNQLAAPFWRRIAAIFAARSGQGGRLVRVRRRYAAIRAMSPSLSAPPKAGMTTPGIPSSALMPRRMTWIRLLGSLRCAALLSARSGRAASGAFPLL